MIILHGSFKWNMLLRSETQLFQLPPTPKTRRVLEYETVEKSWWLMILNDVWSWLACICQALGLTSIDIPHSIFFFVGHIWKCSSSCRWIYNHSELYPRPCKNGDLLLTRRRGTSIPSALVLLLLQHGKCWFISERGGCDHQGHDGHNGLVVGSTAKQKHVGA